MVTCFPVSGSGRVIAEIVPALFKAKGGKLVFPAFSITLRLGFD
jgi:hypothetical protein